MSKSYLSNHYSNKTLEIRYINNGIVLPVKKGKGGVVDSSGKFVEISFHDGEYFKIGGSYYSKELNIKKSKEKVVYLGVFFHQWGHFLLDSLSRSWIINKIKNLKDYKFIFINGLKDNKSINGNYLQALELLGISKEKVIDLKEPTEYKEVIVPEMANTSDRTFTKEYTQIFDTIVSNANINSVKVPKKVYLTRMNLKSAKRKEFGEYTIQNNFLLNDYSIISPEKLNLVEQIAIFQKCKKVVCLNGSIPFGMLFASKYSDILIINKTSLPHANIKEIVAASRATPKFINGYYEPFKNFPKTLGDGPFILNFSTELENYFKDHNLSYRKERKIKLYNDVAKASLVCAKLKIKQKLKEIRIKTID